MKKRAKRIIKYCENCDAEIIVPEYWAARKRFCSKQCVGAFYGARRAEKLKRNRVRKTCDWCGNEYTVIPSKAERSRFCSASCKGRNAARRMNRIRRDPKEYAKPPVHYGKDNPMYVEPIELRCRHCARVFHRKPWEITGNGKTGDYCSAQCRDDYRSKFQSGEDSPYWVGGPKTYRGRGWIRARAKVIERQSGKCARCGRFVGKSLPVHHIIAFREFPTEEEANDIENLIGLCPSCHMKEESNLHSQT